MRFLYVGMRSLMLVCGFALAASAAPWPVRVVVLTMFEAGEPTGDRPGEFQFWVDGERLEKVYPLTAAYHAVHGNADGTVIATVTGMGNTRAAASVMVLGLDPRFDLSKAYWLVAGIAGVELSHR